MTVRATEPAPRRNRTNAGNLTRFTGLTSSDIIVALGDYTGGAADNLFTLTAHGMSTGDVLYCVAQGAQGALTGGPGTRCVVTSLSSSTFTLTSDGTTAITNTADGTVTFLKGNGIPQRVADIIRTQLLIVGLNDTTGGTVEDQFGPYSGATDIAEADTIKLLFKSASGVAGTLDATVYVKAPVAAAGQFYFQTAATAGGAVVDTTADGTAVWLKTS